MTKNYRSLEHMIRDVMVETVVSNAKGMRQGHVSAGRNEYSSKDGGHSAAMSRVKGQEKETKHEEEESKKEKEKEIANRESAESERKTKYRELRSEEIDPDRNTEARKEVENVSRLQQDKPTSKKSKLAKTASITNVLEEPTMFDKNFGLSKSLIDATRSVMETNNLQDPKGKARKNNDVSKTVINPPMNVKEDASCAKCNKSNAQCMCEGGSGFNLAAMAAAKRGDKSFTHGGKTFPVTAKHSMKEENLFSDAELSALKTISEAPYGQSYPSDNSQSSSRPGNQGTKETTDAFMSDETEDPLTTKNKKEHPGRAKEIDKIIKNATKKIFGEETISEATTKNEFRGFHGAAYDASPEQSHEDKSQNANSKYSDAHKDVMKYLAPHLKPGQNIHDVATHFLDSVHGRHCHGLLDNPKYMKQSVGKFMHKYDPDMFHEETISEAGRGRPRKNPLPANAEPVDPEPSDNIMNRVRQSMYAMAGGPQHVITHKDGSKTQLTKNVARVIHNMHSALRTADEKDAFTNKINASHDSLKKTLGY